MDRNSREFSPREPWRQDARQVELLFEAFDQDRNGALTQKELKAFGPESFGNHAAAGNRIAKHIDEVAALTPKTQDRAAVHDGVTKADLRRLQDLSADTTVKELRDQYLQRQQMLLSWKAPARR